MLLINKKSGEVFTKGFVSEQQRKYMWRSHPEIAKKWAHDIPAGSKKSPHRMPTGKASIEKGVHPTKSKKEKAKIIREANKLKGTGLPPTKKEKIKGSLEKALVNYLMV